MSVYVLQNYWIGLSALTANKALVWGFQTVDPDTNHIPKARAGDSTVHIHTEIDFSCVSGQLIIDNNSSGSSIDEIYSTPNNWIIASSVPVGPSGIDTGAQGGTNNPISIEIGDFSSLDNPSCLLMYVNSVLIESKNVTLEPINIQALSKQKSLEKLEANLTEEK